VHSPSLKRPPRIVRVKRLGKLKILNKNKNLKRRWIKLKMANTRGKKVDPGQDLSNGK